MNQSEFNQFLTHHNTNFVGVATKVVEAGSATSWHRVLNAVSLEHAINASNELFATDCHPWWTEHPGKIKALAARMNQCSLARVTPAFTVREPRFDCRYCFDRSIITVFHPIAYQHIIDETYKREKHFRTTTVACHKCERGLCKVRRAGAKEPNSGYMYEFKESVTLREPDVVDCPDGERLVDWQEKQLFDFVTNVIRPRNHHSEFDDWAA